MVFKRRSTSDSLLFMFYILITNSPLSVLIFFFSRLPSTDSISPCYASKSVSLPPRIQFPLPLLNLPLPSYWETPLLPFPFRRLRGYPFRREAGRFYPSTLMFALLPRRWQTHTHAYTCTHTQAYTCVHTHTHTHAIPWGCPWTAGDQPLQDLAKLNVVGQASRMLFRLVSNWSSTWPLYEVLRSARTGRLRLRSRAFKRTPARSCQDMLLWLATSSSRGGGTSNKSRGTDDVLFTFCWPHGEIKYIEVRVERETNEASKSTLNTQVMILIGIGFFYNIDSWHRQM